MMIKAPEKLRDDLQWELIEFVDSFKLSGRAHSADSAEYIKSLSKDADADSEDSVKDNDNKEYDVSDILDAETAQHKVASLQDTLEKAKYFNHVQDMLKKNDLDPHHRTSTGDEIDVTDPIISLKHIALRIGEFEGQITSSTSEDVIKIYQYKMKSSEETMKHLMATIVDLSYAEPYYNHEEEQQKALAAEKSSRNNVSRKSGSMITLAVLLTIALIIAIVWFLNYR